ncbi:hypothetical protein KW785_00760 [Candidatus Parcubacteria bacterium]|nr:hypothetical protein [Candidatus Parcubacteria bacterium]
MGIQSFFLKQMLKSKMKGVPEAEQKRILELVEKNPDFFKKIAEEIEKRKKSGQSEMQASMQVMREHQAELQKLMQP